MTKLGEPNPHVISCKCPFCSPRKGWSHSEKTRKKIAKALIGNKNSLGTKRHRTIHWKLSEATRRRMSTANILKWSDPNYKRRVVSKMLKLSRERPTSLEKKLLGIIIGSKLPYDYVGNGKLIIGGKCPDFVHRNFKLVVETADKRHKLWTTGRNWKDYERQRIKHFSFYGWRCVIIWSDMDEDDIIDLLSENSTKQLLPNFDLTDSD